MKKPTIAIRIPLSIFILFATASLRAQSESPAPATGKSLFELIGEGGWAMIPLGLCSIFMFFLIFYCWKETVRAKFIPDTLLGQVSGYLKARQLGDAQTALIGSDSVLARALAPALTKARPERPDANRTKIETILVENLESEENAVAQWVNYLNVVATVAPMIGLLGTVSGMISAFQTIGAGGMGRPELLAGDIGEALITTATGLVIGIPAMVFYFVMKNRLGNQMIATVQAASNLIDDLAEEPYAEEVNEA
ncbi:MAG: MotA/TolQ/ExbB proton channel family protein [Puniceicoccales bacterium]